MTFKRTVLFALFSVLVSTAAIAELEKSGAENTKQMMSQKLSAFAKLDTEKDGSITLAEAEGTWLADVFQQLDADQNGIVSWEEYRQAK